MHEIAQRHVEFGRIEFDAHQERIRVVVAVLVGMKYIAAVLVDESGNARDNAFAIRTAEKEDGGVFHFDSKRCRDILEEE